MKRVAVLLLAAMVIGLVMSGGVDGVMAFESPISPVLQAPPLPGEGETVTIGGGWEDQVGEVVETQDRQVAPTVRLCVGLTSGNVICYEVW
jgi:hypothetical protein